MGHRCTYIEHLELRDNDIVRMITATYKDKKDTVYYERLKDGECFGRYIEYSYMSGYLVTFKGEKKRLYYGYNEIMEEQDFEPYNQLNICGINKNSFVKRLAFIEKVHPELKYLFLKLKSNKTYQDINNAYLFEIIRKYWKHPELENLIIYNQLSLAMDERFYKLSKSKLKEVINFIKNNHKKYPQYEMKLSDILGCLKHNIPLDKLNFFRQCKSDINLFNYLNKQNSNINIHYYQDYIQMVKDTGHNADDPYWKYPSDIVLQHNKLMNELALIEKQKHLELQNKFKLVSDNISKLNNYIIDNYLFYIPNDYADVVAQAKTLNQCLITCDYISKMIEQKSILIFIKNNEKRIGTIEINYNKKIIQAYGDELNRNSCSLPKQIMDYAKQFIDKLKIKKNNYDFTGALICQASN